MVEVVQKVSGKKVRIPLAGPANRQGRIAATNALGGSMKYRGALGTSVVKLLDSDRRVDRSHRKSGERFRAERRNVRHTQRQSRGILPRREAAYAKTRIRQKNGPIIRRPRLRLRRRRKTDRRSCDGACGKHDRRRYFGT